MKVKVKGETEMTLMREEPRGGRPVEIRNTLGRMLAFKVKPSVMFLGKRHTCTHSFPCVSRWDMESSGVQHDDGWQQLRSVPGLAALMEETCSGPDSCRQISGAAGSSGI